jgi:hypothetical protein
VRIQTNKKRGDIMNFNELMGQLKQLDYKNLYHNDFFLTWDKTQDDLMAIWTVADMLRRLRENNISPKVFDSGLGISV